MHPGASDSSGAGPSSAGERRPEPGEDAAAPSGPGGRSWRVAGAVAVLAAASFYLGCGAAGGAGLGAVLLRFSLMLLGAAAVYLLGTLLALVFRSRQAPPPDFAAAWSRLAARRRPGVSTRLPLPVPAAGDRGRGVRGGPVRSARRWGASRPSAPGEGLGLRAAEVRGVLGRSRPDAALQPASGGRRARSPAVLPVLRAGTPRPSPGHARPLAPEPWAPRPAPSCAPGSGRSAALGRGCPSAPEGGCGRRGGRGAGEGRVSEELFPLRARPPLSALAPRRPDSPTDAWLRPERAAPRGAAARPAP